MDDEKWYYDLATRQVAQGKKASGHNRMGPYDTREEAEHAMERAAARNAAADDAEKRWREG